MPAVRLNYPITGDSLKAAMYGAGAEYALHSLLTLASRSEPVSVRDLATFQRIPVRFLAKLFTRLKKAGLVKGTEGIAGGFVLSRPAKNIQVLEVLDAIDPGRTLFECAEIRQNCALYGRTPPAWATTGPCRIHAFMTEADRALRRFLAAKSLAELAGEFKRKAPGEFVEASDQWFRNQIEGRGVRRRD
jgi:Rrf2 family protein